MVKVGDWILTIPVQNKNRYYKSGIFRVVKKDSGGFYIRDIKNLSFSIDNRRNSLCKYYPANKIAKILYGVS